MNYDAAIIFLDTLLMVIVYIAIFVFAILRIIELYKSKTVFYWDYKRFNENFLKLATEKNNKELEEEINLFFSSGRKKIILSKEEFEKVRSDILCLYEKIKLETELTCEVSEFLIGQMYNQKSNKNSIHISNHKLSKSEKKLLNSVFCTASSKMKEN